MFKKKKEKEQKYEKIKRHSEGDRLTYYILHSAIATLLFIVIAMRLEFFSLTSDQISFLFTWDYVMLVFVVFIWNIVCTFIARILGYYILRSVYWKTQPRNIYDLNAKGINKLSIRYFFALFITSVLWSLGALLIITQRLFGNQETLALILTYLIIKMIVFVITKVIIDAKT